MCECISWLSYARLLISITRCETVFEIEQKYYILLI